MKIYTKTGDQGETGLRGGMRVPKKHPRVAAYGEVDELNSCLGVAESVLPRRPAFAALRRNLRRIQAELFHLGAVLSSPPDHPDAKEFPMDFANKLETEIDRMTKDLKPLRQFILPGGSQAGAMLHLCRAICRRAERSLGTLPPSEVPSSVWIYLNRLSDHLFTAARWVNHRLKSSEARWPGLKA